MNTPGHRSGARYALILLVSAAREELGAHQGEAVGVGSVIAALHMARLLAEQRASAVLMIGTASAYPGGPPIGTAVAARRVGFADAGAALGLSYVPRPPPAITCDARLLRHLEVGAVNVLSLPAVTTDSELALRLSDGWEAEQLEVYGVAMACQEARVPFAAVFGVTGVAGPDAHASWLTNRGIAREAARKAIMPLLDVGPEFFVDFGQSAEE
jgi:futalosine hydrolase